MEPIIQVNDVSMRFNLAKEKSESLKEYFLQIAHGKLKFDEFYALKNVSLDVQPGDFYGLIGLNGSGKSTLLKVISGVYKPTSGSCTVRGTIAPLIELGAVLGFTPKYIRKQFDEIVEFSELQDFLDVPLKNYSSGMVARIAFAIATVTEPDVLIVDETLSVGDVFFQEKCEARIKSFIDSGHVTVLFVSHSIEQVERICTRAVWIEKGQQRMDGPVEEVCRAYRAQFD